VTPPLAVTNAGAIALARGADDLLPADSIGGLRSSRPHALRL